MNPTIRAVALLVFGITYLEQGGDLHRAEIDIWFELSPEWLYNGLE